METQNQTKHIPNQPESSSISLGLTMFRHTFPADTAHNADPGPAQRLRRGPASYDVRCPKV